MLNFVNSKTLVASPSIYGGKDNVEKNICYSTRANLYVYGTKISEIATYVRKSHQVTCYSEVVITLSMKNPRKGVIPAMKLTKDYRMLQHTNFHIMNT